MTENFEDGAKTDLRYLSLNIVPEEVVFEQKILFWSSVISFGKCTYRINILLLRNSLPPPPMQTFFHST